MRYFNTSEELLELFGIDTKKKGARLFCTLVDLLALMNHFPVYKVSVSMIARAMMEEQGLSSKVFWSLIKRDLKPIFQEDPTALQALGLWVGGNLTLTVPYLAECVADILEHNVSNDLAEYAACVAVRLGRAR